MKPKDIIPKDTRYVPFVQEKTHCVPACISMIMYHQGIPLISQQVLGHAMGMIVHRDDKKLFWSPPKASANYMGRGYYGTQIGLKKYHPNTVFPKLGIPLEMVFHPISSFDKSGIKKFLLETQKSDKDIIVCFDAGKLNGHGKRGGHVSVFDVVEPSKNSVRIVDPQQSRPKWRNISISLLYESMKLHGDKNMGGFWEFRKKIL
ncbi:MAG: hypothetical protein AAB400_02005 [Patescibacteria group bacterium]